MAHHAIYVPGLGDHRSFGQDYAIQIWRLYGIIPHYLPLEWRQVTGIETKLDRLMNEVKKIKSAGHSVSLVGVSAGASAVLNAYATSDLIDHVVCISGKINNPHTVGERTFKVNPDFRESLNALTNSLKSLNPEQRKKIMSIHCWRDQTVPIADTRISGVIEKTLPGWSHSTGIFFGVIFGAYSISRFIKL